MNDFGDVPASPRAGTCRIAVDLLLACGIVAVALSVAWLDTAVKGAALLTVAALAFGWFSALVWRHPHLAAYTFAVGFPLTAGMPRLPALANLRPAEVLLASLLIGLIVRMVLRREPIPRLCWVDGGALALVATGSILPIATQAVRQGNLGGPGVNEALWPVKSYMVYWTIRLAICSTEHARKTAALAVICSVVVAIVGILQGMQLSFVSALLNAWYPSIQVSQAGPFSRITSVLGGWNDLGVYLTFVLLAASALMLARVRLLPTPVLFAALAIDVGALLITGSIASLAGLLIGLIIAVVAGGQTAQLRRLLGPVFVAAGVAAMLFSPLLIRRLQFQYNAGSSGIIPVSFLYRIFLWKTYFLPLIAQHVVFGVGLTIPSTIPWTTTDSGYLGLLFYGGTILLIAYLFFTGAVVYTGRKLLAGHERVDGICHTTAIELGRGTGIAAISIVLVLLFMNITEAYYTYSAAVSILWMVLALSTIPLTGLGTPRQHKLNSSVETELDVADDVTVAGDTASHVVTRATAEVDGI